MERSGESNSWTEISNSDSTSKTFEYTPVADNAEKTLRFKATYKDEYHAVNAKTIGVETENTVLAAPRRTCLRLSVKTRLSRSRLVKTLP